jgi:hypothetical protein
MRWLALIPLLFLVPGATAQSPPEGTCVTIFLRLAYFGLEAPERSLALTENLRPPEEETAAEPAPAPPPPAAPGGGGFGGGVPDCEPIVRPAGDPVALQVCEQAPTFGRWTCHLSESTIVIEDVRYAVPSPAAAPKQSHGGSKN